MVLMSLEEQPIKETILVFIKVPMSVLFPIFMDQSLSHRNYLFLKTIA